MFIIINVLVYCALRGLEREPFAHTTHKYSKFLWAKAYILKKYLALMAILFLFLQNNRFFLRFSKIQTVQMTFLSIFSERRGI